jgi:hypothetical protein
MECIVIVSKNANCLSGESVANTQQIPEKKAMSAAGSGELDKKDISQASEAMQTRSESG